MSGGLSMAGDAFVPKGLGGGLIPVLHARGKSVAQAWENSLVELWRHGYKGAPTQYDQEGNPPSVDATMEIIVEEPISEPRFHRCVPGGPADFQEYRMEVVDGIKDHWIDRNDPAKWQYTYHQRLTKYVTPGTRQLVTEHGNTQQVKFDPINQIQKVIDQLAAAPHTRRAQGVTWQPWTDPDSKDPPCWRSFWCRILEDEEGDLWLHMNVDFRSRDAFKAAMMNMDAVVEFMIRIAEGVSKRIVRPIYIGRLVDRSDSYHIYGKDIPEFENRFLRGLHTRPFADRTYRTSDIGEMMTEAIPVIHEKIKAHDASRS